MVHGRAHASPMFSNLNCSIGTDCFAQRLRSSACCSSGPLGVSISTRFACRAHRHVLYPRIFQGRLLLFFWQLGSDVASQDFASNPARVQYWPALRQDSGDPFAFAPAARDMYSRLAIDHRTKRIVYSDSVTVDLALRLKVQCDELGFSCTWTVFRNCSSNTEGAFGVGTNFSNDYNKQSSPQEKSPALNIVIKIAMIDGRPCIKISDDLTKVCTRSLRDCVGTQSYGDHWRSRHRHGSEGDARTRKCMICPRFCVVEAGARYK